MRKAFSFFLCLVLVLSLTMPALATEEKADLYIRSVEDFLQFSRDCRLDSYSKDLVVSLEADIDLTGVEFTPIPWFGGTFMGNQHTISGLKITENGSFSGLFRYVAQGATVKDLSVRGEIAPGGSREQVGGIAGSNAGLIENCHFEGSVAGSKSVGGIVGTNEKTGWVIRCTENATVQGSHFVGGIVGKNKGLVSNCENFGSINATEKQNQVSISDITLEGILGVESVTTATDIGGIAGNNTGKVVSCVNRGTVGYPQMGYNVGGIAGSQSGYLVECENFGVVSGRKDVGGIVGQAEPWIQVRYETDTLQMLKAELGVLADLTEKLAKNLDKNTQKIKKQVDAIEKHLSDAQKALDTITKEELQEQQVYLDALRQLSGSIDGIEKAVEQLYTAVQDTTGRLEKDVKAVSEQVSVITELLETGEENLGVTVEDVSDGDTQEDLTAKIFACVNFGSVRADENVGGIAGVMGFENDADPEEDLSISGEESLNVAVSIRCVVRQCVNSGSVNGKKDNAGGMAGKQLLGLVKDCVHAGVVAGGNFVGGIVGDSRGIIRNCAARGQVSGKYPVGGIAGQGRIVTDCRSMVTPAASEKMGAVLGVAAENAELLGNLYAPLGDDPGGVDGISYAGQAEPMELEAFLELEDLPASFLQVSVTFVQEDGTEKVIALRPGEALTHIPEVAKKDAHEGVWKGLAQAELDCVVTDLRFEAEYTPYKTTLASAEKRDGKPVMLVQGSFHPAAALTIEKISGPRVADGEKLLEAWSVSVPNDPHVHGIRLLAPKEGQELTVYVRREGKWEKAEFVTDGSYLSVKVECGDDGVALVASEAAAPWWQWVLLGGGVLLILVIPTVLILAKKKKKTAAEEVAVEV